MLSIPKLIGFLSFVLERMVILALQKKNCRACIIFPFYTFYILMRYNPMSGFNVCSGFPLCLTKMHILRLMAA